MTDEAKALVDGDHNGSEQTFRDTERNLRDLIETQAREIERLNAILSELNDTDKIMANAPHWERSNDK